VFGADLGPELEPEQLQQSICAVFDRQVADHPESIALRQGDVSVSYRHLDRAASKVGRLLQQLGIRHGMTVAVAMPRAPSFIAVLIGILKVGAAYLPLDPNWPAQRVATVLETASAALFITDGSTSRLPTGSVRRLELGNDIFGEAETSEVEVPMLSSSVQASDVAYICFTSGSSGTPKGVMVPHRGVVSLVIGQNYGRFSKDTVTLQHTSPGFDVAAAEIWVPLLSGGTCVLLHGAFPSVGRLGAAIRAGGVNTLFLTTALFNVIVDTSIEILERLTSVFIGGEAQSPHHVRVACKRLAGVALSNVYGPTEATVIATHFPLDRLAAGALTVPIGRAINHREVLVVKPDGVIASPGEVGELWITGPGVALGYVNRPDLTAERFVSAALGTNEHRTFYRTGDLTLIDDEGELQFIGRSDGQVKVNGYRIELSEIEHALVAHPEVRQAAVVVHGEGLAKKLKAVLVVTRWPLADIAEFLAMVLPAYMLPAEYRSVEAIPINFNGKVDREAIGRLFDMW
jgi:D-alanine--poly(phosphoribitol) ligase subunit 1